MPSASMGQAPAGGRISCSAIASAPRATAKLTRFMHDALSARGYEVQINRPYAGGFITEYYGNPARGVHALQLEINRGLYLDELDPQPRAGLPKLQMRSAEILRGPLFNELPALLERRAAAE